MTVCLFSLAAVSQDNTAEAMCDSFDFQTGSYCIWVTQHSVVGGFLAPCFTVKPHFDCVSSVAEPSVYTVRSCDWLGSSFVGGYILWLTVIMFFSWWWLCASVDGDYVLRLMVIMFFGCHLLVLLSNNPEIHTVLGEKVVCATISPHMYI